ncbi:MAG: 6-carboxytetrahydropterin synthase [Methylobacteriaceae bacterium]|nr:6-carboxytetrahydropterin synthase [Methylobacteriaceae bacterium]
MFQVFKEFRFEAAHTLIDPNDRDNRYSRLHGHSFRARVTVEGEPNDHGWVVDLGELERRLGAIRERLDHRFLNEINGLGLPTLENICAYIWREIAADVPGLSEVAVYRDSCGEGCVYRGG